MWHFVEVRPWAFDKDYFYGLHKKKKIPITEIIGIKKGFGYDLEIKLSFI